MARPERFELPTARFVAEYSIQLSYGRVEARDYPRAADKVQGAQEQARDSPAAGGTARLGSALTPVSKSAGGDSGPAVHVCNEVFAPHKIRRWRDPSRWRRKWNCSPLALTLRGGFRPFSRTTMIESKPAILSVVEGWNPPGRSIKKGTAEVPFQMLGGERGIRTLDGVSPIRP